MQPEIMAGYDATPNAVFRPVLFNVEHNRIWLRVNNENIWWQLFHDGFALGRGPPV